MEKSKIIRDLANGVVDTATALKRVKVLLSELDNAEVQNWVNYEIAGYPQDAVLPSYRVASGNLVGSYFKGSMANHMTWKNVSIPLGNMPDDMQENLLKIEFFDGIEALKQLQEKSKAVGQTLSKPIPADYFPYIAKYNNDRFMIITSARVEISEQWIPSIFSVVENRLLDLLLLLEKEFGNLDELDLDTSSKTQEELESVANQISIIIYNDNRVQVGDKNKIEGSKIASAIRENAGR